MTETTTVEDTGGHPILKSVVLFVRLLQASAVALAAILVIGALIGGMHVLAFVMIAVVAMLLLLVVLVLELVAVRGLRRWASDG